MDKITIRNPSDNYKVIDTFDATSFQEIDRKIIKAKKAFTVWSQTSLLERISILNTFLEACKNKKDEIARFISLEMGMPLFVCKEVDVDLGLLHLEGYLKYAEQWLAPEVTYENEQEIHTLYYEPLGVIGASIPWNYPFSNFIWAVGQHLVVGNTVVIKHSEHSVLVTKLLEEIILSIPKLSDCCQFIYGDGKTVGNYVMNSKLDMIWFTGSTKTGHIVYQVAAQKGIPATLELGGSAPAIVMQDADIDMSVISIFLYRFINSGQTCDGIKRLLVHESIFESFVEMLKNYTQSKQVGSALQQGTHIGPLVNEIQLERLEEQVADAIDKGAKVILGGKRPQNLFGAYYEPTILTNISFDMAVWQEEVFGPVLPVVPFSTVPEAIKLANDTQYGLGGYVYTQDQDIAMKISKSLQTGNVSVNNASYVIPQNPFGGYKVAPGFGRIHGRFGLQNFCNLKLVSLKK